MIEDICYCVLRCVSRRFGVLPVWAV